MYQDSAMPILGARGCIGFLTLNDLDRRGFAYCHIYSKLRFDLQDSNNVPFRARRHRG